jgi:hypothetical protein
MTAPSDSSSSGSSGNWLFKNKEHGKASAAASLVRYSVTYILYHKVSVLIVTHQ